MRSQRGIALIMAPITAPMLLAFLTVVGGALLSGTTLDFKILENYANSTFPYYPIAVWEY